MRHKVQDANDPIPLKSPAYIKSLQKRRSPRGCSGWRALANRRHRHGRPRLRNVGGLRRGRTRNLLIGPMAKGRVAWPTHGLGLLPSRSAPSPDLYASARIPAKPLVKDFSPSQDVARRALQPSGNNNHARAFFSYEVCSGFHLFDRPCRLGTGTDEHTATAGQPGHGNAISRTLSGPCQCVAR